MGVCRRKAPISYASPKFFVIGKLGEDKELTTEYIMTPYTANGSYISAMCGMPKTAGCWEGIPKNG